jgi:hypothetical protein
MNYVLFAFGDYTKEDQKINLIVDFVSQISTKEVKFQYGESGIIVSFATLSKSEDISDFFDDCLTKLTAMFFVFPVSDNSIMSMDGEIYEHLFDEPDKKSGKTQTIDYGLNFDFDYKFENSDSTHSIKEVFDKIFGNVTEPEIILTLDQILDKINDNGFESLTNTEKKQLEEYSNK